MYNMYSMGCFKFLDSYNFLALSLDQIMLLKQFYKKTEYQKKKQVDRGNEFYNKTIEAAQKCVEYIVI